MIYNEGYSRVVPEVHPVFFRSWQPTHPKAHVVCVHGAGGNAAHFEALAQAAVVRGIQVTAFDGPGNGYSVLANVPAQSQFAHLIRVLDHFCRQSDLPLGLVASSAGALLVFSYLYGGRQLPHMGGIPVVFSEPAFAFDATTAQFLQQFQQTFLARPFVSLDDAMQAWRASPMGGMVFDSEEDQRRYVRQRLRPTGTGLLPLLMPQKSMAVLASKPFDILRGKSTLRNPALCLWNPGRDAQIEQVRQVLPQSVHQVFPGTVHPLSLTCQVEMAPTVDFLSDHLL